MEHKFTIKEIEELITARIQNERKILARTIIDWAEIESNKARSSVVEFNDFKSLAKEIENDKWPGAQYLKKDQ